MYDIIEIIDNYICFEKKLITMRENDIRDEARRKIKLQEHNVWMHEDMRLLTKF